MTYAEIDSVYALSLFIAREIEQGSRRARELESLRAKELVS